MGTISWSELVTLMVHGPDLPTRGRLRHASGSGREPLGWARSAGTPVPPPFATGVEVAMRGRRIRLADAEGRMTFIADGERAWTFDPEVPAAPPRESPFDHVEFGLQGSDVLLRSTARTWLDFDVAGAPEPTPTTFAGRRAWAVGVAHPEQADRVFHLVVDAETGMLLHRRDDRRGRLTEWTDVAVGGEDLEPATFRWDGPVVSWEQQLVDAQRQGEREQVEWAERHARWTHEELGLDRVDVTVSASLLVRQRDDGGTLHASLGDLGDLGRRPRSDDAWPEFEARGDDDEVHRWSDERWDWALRTWTPLAQGAVDALRAQLRRARASE